MAEVLMLMLILSMPVIVTIGLVFGMSTPIHHEREEKFELPVSASQVWTTISDIGAYPSWLKHVLETKCEDEDQQIWFQESDVVPVRFRVKAREPERFLELEIMPGNIRGKNIPVDGTLSIQLDALDQGRTQVTVHHQGNIKDALLRTFLFFFHRYDYPAKVLHDSLKRKFK